MTLYAHSRPGRPHDEWEPLSHHLLQVAVLASGFASAFGAGDFARAAGLLHDIGKCSHEFQAYIRGSAAERGPDHSTAGAIVAAGRYTGLAGRLIAFAITGHHAGLADGAGTGGTLTDRLARKDLPAHDGWEAETGPLPEKPMLNLPQAAGYQGPKGYSAAFLGRMLFSCLVDADFLATEAFYGKTERGGHATPAILRDRLDRFLTDITAKAPATPLNALRAEILAHARAKASLAPGLFTMTVPTGGGKTLASLAFALDHAVAHGLDRVVYVIPYTSIIEQTAGIFADALGKDDVLEHHGNVDWEGSAGATDDEGRDGLAKLRRAAENWDVPVVVTTAVQFFESLHAARTSRCRKLHNLARSVVVLDEAQMLPVHLLRPCMAAIAELAGNYGASLVLCTATQPALKKQDDFKDGLDIAPDRELAPDPARLYRALERVTVERLPDPVDDATIAARFAEQPQMLCIVNGRRHAQLLFDAIRHLDGARHLTTLMCPAHRRGVLAAVRDDLKDGRPVRLVATSLIEAGVDVDFPEVWRAETGLDSIAQAAGRCNREGRRNHGRVVVFASADLKAPTAFALPTAAMRAALRQHGDDPLGLDAVRAYFRELYWSKGEERLDAGTLPEGDSFPILPAIAAAFAPPYDFPYAGIAGAFRMIDDVMDPVIVPWRGGDDPDEVENLVKVLRVAIGNGGRLPGHVLRRLQQFTVSIPTRVRSRMIATGAVELVDRSYGDRFVILTGGKYDDDTGLALDEYAMTAESITF